MRRLRARRLCCRGQAPEMLKRRAVSDVPGGQILGGQILGDRDMGVHICGGDKA